MPRDKTQSHIRIVNAAKAEFMEHGFSEASLRRIASEAGIQVSGLYKHFSNKEEMFDSLVEPAINGFYELYHDIEKTYFDGIESLNPGDEWESAGEAVRVMSFIYDHMDEFKLLIFGSVGTKYEDFIHDVARLEEKVTLRYMNELKAKGCNVKDVDEMDFHLLTTSYIEALFKPLGHGLDREKAMHYARTLEEFYAPAWKAWFGI